MCKDCRRQFVPDAIKKGISPHTWELINKLLVEKIPLAGIARVASISETYLQEYGNRKYETVPREVRVRAPKTGG